MRPVGPVEAALGVSILGSVLAVGVPAFSRNLRASRLVEPVEGLGRLAARATALAALRPVPDAYPETVGLTPEHVPRGAPALDPPGSWDHPTWRALDFSFTAPHSFSFSFESAFEPGRANFRAAAEGDLDGDGQRSSFEITGEAREGAEPVTNLLESRREVE